MNYDNMTRDEAIQYAGIEAVKAVEAENCDFTNRVTAGTEWDGWCEFSASVRLHDDPNNRECLTAYYYQRNEDVDATEDLGSLTWVIDHYSLW